MRVTTFIQTLFLATAVVAGIMPGRSETALKLFEARSCSSCGDTSNCCGCCQEGVCCTEAFCGCPGLKRKRYEWY
ncbi:uncharacterized protein K444DRAFT_609493 [Hyaloscypha bicolor E]|uniref:Uncharacterized protein n=1 Tax=Hyaloscypha bicolor E TaxID=1095630 RepID=A0A2J6TLM2_9HELO|nr:uncharacterized protein K444DRAFT_609493 [Hyaloscypha bicolor E]PMD63907.1 hypothetical protein K444DRAFT_609493 [Hyaloscypha bicolor E]